MTQYTLQPDQALSDDLQELALLRDEMHTLACQLETEILVMQAERLLAEQKKARSSAFRAHAPALRHSWQCA